MGDFLTEHERSAHMGRVRQSGTAAEMIVRRVAQRLGYRFRVCRKDLPGSPDLAFIGRRAAIFVHGCFWHRHADCRKATMPKRNREFWQKKFDANQARDARVIRELDEMGWRVLVVWECQTAHQELLAGILKSFLGAK